MVTPRKRSRKGDVPVAKFCISLFADVCYCIADEGEEPGTLPQKKGLASHRQEHLAEENLSYSEDDPGHCESECVIINSVVFRHIADTIPGNS